MHLINYKRLQSFVIEYTKSSQVLSASHQLLKGFIKPSPDQNCLMSSGNAIRWLDQQRFM